MPSNMFKLSSKYGTELKQAVLLRGPFLLFVFHVCHTVLSVPCNLVVTCRERAGLMSLLFVIFSCVFFVTFPYSVLGQLCCLIVSIPDLCLLAYFEGGWSKNCLRVVVLLKYLYLH